MSLSLKQHYSTQQKSHSIRDVVSHSHPRELMPSQQILRSFSLFSSTKPLSLSLLSHWLLHSFSRALLLQSGTLSSHPATITLITNPFPTISHPGTEHAILFTFNPSSSPNLASSGEYLFICSNMAVGWEAVCFPRRQCASLPGC